VDTPHGRIGLLICADTFDDGILRRMAAHKLDLLLVPYGWAAQETEWPGHGRALEHTARKAAKAVNAPLIGTDLVGVITHGPWRGRVFGGQSVAAGAEGTILARGKDRDSDIVLVRLSLQRETE